MTDAQDDTAQSEALPLGAPAPFICTSPKTPTPFLFAVPHSGRHYPDAMRRTTRLTDHTLRLSEDAFVDKLFAHVPDQGATLLVATHARAYLDLNRAADELDRAMFTPPLEGMELNETHRVKAGLGLIPKVVAENVPIYGGQLPAREALYRTEQVYHPYHNKLQDLIRARQAQFGHAILIDCHSMPSEAHSVRRRTRSTGPDIVLGDNWGSACARELTSLAEELAICAGFSVRRNVPYSGGFTTQHYGDPNTGVHALQIEISRGIYMDENTLEPLDCFMEVQEKFRSFSENLIERCSAHIRRRNESDMPRAAE